MYFAQGGSNNRVELRNIVLKVKLNSRINQLKQREVNCPGVSLTTSKKKSKQS